MVESIFPPPEQITFSGTFAGDEAKESWKVRTITYEGEKGFFVPAADFCEMLALLHEFGPLKIEKINREMK